MRYEYTNQERIISELVGQKHAIEVRVQVVWLVCRLRGRRSAAGGFPGGAGGGGEEAAGADGREEGGRGLVGGERGVRGGGTREPQAARRRPGARQPQRRRSQPRTPARARFMLIIVSVLCTAIHAALLLYLDVRSLMTSDYSAP